MRQYHTKWLEILSIVNQPEGHVMNVRLANEEHSIIQWKIDSFTAEQLQMLTENSNPSAARFRLSLFSEWNAVDQQYFSHITRYDKNSQSKHRFPCSETFAKNLSSLQETNHFHEIQHESAFIQLNPAQTEVDIPVTQSTLLVRKPSIKKYRNSILIAALLITIILSVAVAGSSLTHETALANTAKSSADSELYPLIQSVNDTPIQHLDVSHPKLATAAQTVPIPVQESEQTLRNSPDKRVAVPAVTLDKFINFGVPKHKVALTFDDGPSKYTEDLVDVLNHYQVGATFFFVGDQVKKFPEAVKYTDENGYTIGNHSMTHPDLQKLSVAKQLREIIETNKLIEAIILKPVTLFRPPYGSMNTNTKAVASQTSMKITLWNNDTEDWKTKNPQKVLNHIQHSNLNGAVILLHESKKTLQVLPSIIEYLQKQEYEIVNLQ